MAVWQLKVDGVQFCLGCGIMKLLLWENCYIYIDSLSTPDLLKFTNTWQHAIIFCFLLSFEINFICIYTFQTFWAPEHHSYMFSLDNIIQIYNAGLMLMVTILTEHEPSTISTQSRSAYWFIASDEENFPQVKYWEDQTLCLCFPSQLATSSIPYPSICLKINSTACNPGDHLNTQ